MKLFPGLLDKIKPIIKQITKGMYHGRNIVDTALKILINKTFTKNIAWILLFIYNF